MKIKITNLDTFNHWTQSNTYKYFNKMEFVVSIPVLCQIIIILNLIFQVLPDLFHDIIEEKDQATQMKDQDNQENDQEVPDPQTKITKALIEAGVPISKKKISDITGIHWRCVKGCLDQERQGGHHGRRTEPWKFWEVPISVWRD